MARWAAGPPVDRRAIPARDLVPAELCTLRARRGPGQAPRRAEPLPERTSSWPDRTASSPRPSATSAAAATATVDLHLRDNSVQNIDDNTAFPFGAVYGTRVESRHNTSLCLDMASNTSTHVDTLSAGITDFHVRQRNASVFRMERLTDNDGTANGINTSEPNVANFVVGQNDAGSTANAKLLNGFTVAADGACRDVP